jgi:hypothetical protein
MMFLATGKKEFGRRRTTTLCFQIRVRYTVLTSSIPSGPWDNGWFETAAIMINMGQDTPGKDMENIFELCCPHGSKGPVGSRSLPKVAGG